MHITLHISEKFNPTRAKFVPLFTFHPLFYSHFKYGNLYRFILTRRDQSQPEVQNSLKDTPFECDTLPNVT